MLVSGTCTIIERSAQELGSNRPSRRLRLRGQPFRDELARQAFVARRDELGDIDIWTGVPSGQTRGDGCPYISTRTPAVTVCVSSRRLANSAWKFRKGEMPSGSTKTTPAPTLK